MLFENESVEHKEDDQSSGNGEDGVVDVDTEFPDSGSDVVVADFVIGGN